MSSFHPHQIVCLSCQDNALYGEVIQVIPDRAFLWVRPLLLRVGETADSIDVRESADLILPIELFRPALDTEVIPILSEFIKENIPKNSRVYLQCFIKQVWQNNLECFKH